MSGPVSLQRQGEVAVLTIDTPPVNALFRAKIEGLAAALDPEQERLRQELHIEGVEYAYKAGASAALLATIST